MAELKKSSRAVQAAIEAAGLDCQVVELPSSTRTAKEAAKTIGCDVAQIAKSLVFRGKESGQAVLVIASGVNRVDEKLIATQLGEPIKRATPEFVREATGFAIGGVAPCGHPAPITTFIDRDLFELPELWAAAGTPHTVFRLEADHLPQLTGGTVIEVAEGDRGGGTVIEVAER